MITPNEYEKLVLGVIFNYPNGNNLIPQKVCSELTPDKFSKNHKKIFSVINQLVYQQENPTVINVASSLGKDLESIGGIEYLNSLKDFLSDIGVNSFEDYQKWVEAVDKSGRLMVLKNHVDEYTKLFSDFDIAFGQVEDVDEFYQTFVSKIDSGVKSGNTGYEDISVAVEGAKRRLAESGKGKKVDIINTGIQTLERYHIPRPASFGIIGGLPSMGKTQLAVFIILAVAIDLYINKKEGFVTINSLETTKDRIVERMACMLVGIDSLRLADGNLEEYELDNYVLALDFVARLPIKINDNPDITSTGFVSSAVASHLFYGKRVLGVSDYIELFRDKNENEEQRVSNIVRNSRRVCWMTGSCEILITQYSNKVFSSLNKMGNIASSRYSGSIGQAADWFIEVYNPIQMTKSKISFSIPTGMNDDRCYFLIEKNRDYPVGQAEVLWIPETKQFIDQSLPMGTLFKGFNMSMLREEDF